LDFVALHAQSKPDAVAQIEGDRSLTWRELLERRNRVANALVKQGVGRGEHVIIYAPNSLEYLLASAATRAINAVPIPMNHRLVAEEVSYILEHSDAVAAFVGGPYVAMAEGKSGATRPECACGSRWAPGTGPGPRASTSSSNRAARIHRPSIPPRASAAP
jgi:acyl-CoA synthetase (AMP-forming)/AMP-acid ligase II